MITAMNLTCVKCTSVLDKSKVGDIEVDLCPDCGGLWLDAGEIERLNSAASTEVAALRTALASSSAQAAPSDTTAHCPACSAALREVVLGPVGVDVCTGCKGVFLDRGELDQALAAVKGSTLQQVLAAASSAT